MKICPACSREYPADRTHCERDGVALVALTTGATGKAEDLVGQTVDGRYLIEGIVGRGGMGTVYACRHVVVGKPFAMKVVRPGTEQTSDVLQRFIREAQTANSIRSRHIVEMTDFGQLQSGQFYMTMELLEGMDLGKALKRGLSSQQLLHIFIQCADVLELTHQRGVVHRDLKPDNIFLVQEDNDPLFVKLLDFGIAKALHSGPSGLTETGVVLGTPYYMSPEQARGADVDHRTDIYSLGVIMYRAFAGKLPFVADSAVGVLTRHLTEMPELPSRVGGVEPLTERVILTCLEKRPENRFPSMASLAAALRSILAGQRPVFGVRDDPTTNDRAGVPVGPSLSGAMPAYGSQAGLGASQPVAAASPYAPPAALSASQQNAALSGANPAYAANPYAPPPALGASQQAPAARPVSFTGSQQAPAARPVSFTGSQQAPAARPVSFTGSQQAPAARPVSFTGSQQAAQSGPYAQAPAPSAAYPQAGPPSGAYAQAPQTASGAYAQAAPQTASGAYPQGGPPSASGPYAQVAPASISGSYPQGGPPSASGPYAQAAPPTASGAYAQAAPPSISGAYPQGAPQPSGPPSQGFGGSPEWTAAHGLAASQAMRIEQPRKKWPIIAGAVGMLAIGAVVAFKLAHTPAADTGPTGAAGSSSATTTAASATTAASNDAPTGTSTASAAAASGSPATTAASGAGPATKPTGAIPKSTASPKATTSASAATTTTTKRPEIRSPFD